MTPWLHLQDSPWILVEATFFPALGVAVGASLVRHRNYRNFVFPFLLAVLTVADCLFLAVHLGWLDPLPFDPLRLAADVPVALIAVVGGRIVPVFTRNALLRAGIQCDIVPSPRLDRAALLAVAAMIGLDVLCQDTPLAGGASAVAATLLGFRLWRWQGHRTLRMPIVWILHAGYAWLVVGLALKSLWLVGHVTVALNWLHALTAGAFGTMILAVMTRVALGHTGRELKVASSITVAYVLVIAGAMLRVLASAAMPSLYLATLVVASALWSGAFTIFVVVYLPILLGPRADAQSVGGIS